MQKNSFDHRDASLRNGDVSLDWSAASPDHGNESLIWSKESLDHGYSSADWSRGSQDQIETSPHWSRESLDHCNEVLGPAPGVARADPRWRGERQHRPIVGAPKRLETGGVYSARPGGCTHQCPGARLSCSGSTSPRNYLANSIARVSRRTVTLISPGNVISSLTRFAMLCAMRYASSSPTRLASTITRTSRPAWIA